MSFPCKNRGRKTKKRGCGGTADALVSGSSVERRVGSNPVIRTKCEKRVLAALFFVFCVVAWCRTRPSDLLCTTNFDVASQIARRCFLRLCVSKVLPPYTAKRRKLGQTGIVYSNRLLFNYPVIRTKLSGRHNCCPLLIF